MVCREKRLDSFSEENNCSVCSAEENQQFHSSSKDPALTHEHKVETLNTAAAVILVVIGCLFAFGALKVILHYLLYLLMPNSQHDFSAGWLMPINPFEADILMLITGVLFLTKKYHNAHRLQSLMLVAITFTQGFVRLIFVTLTYVRRSQYILEERPSVFLGFIQVPPLVKVIVFSLLVLLAMAALPVLGIRVLHCENNKENTNVVTSESESIDWSESYRLKGGYKTLVNTVRISMTMVYVLHLLVFLLLTTTSSSWLIELEFLIVFTIEILIGIICSVFFALSFFLESNTYALAWSIAAVTVSALVGLNVMGLLSA